MPPPQPCRSPACAPEPTPVAYVPNAPISNSFGLKNSGGGGGGAITCFEDTTGSPAKVAIACEANITTAKATSLFIFVCYTACCRAAERQTSSSCHAVRNRTRKIASSWRQRKNVER